MAYAIAWNGIDYPDCLLRIDESVGAWEKDDADNWYLDIFVTVNVRVPVGYDGFIFGLEAYGWEYAASYLHEVITDNTLLFRFD